MVHYRAKPNKFELIYVGLGPVFVAKLVFKYYHLPESTMCLHKELQYFEGRTFFSANTMITLRGGLRDRQILNSTLTNLIHNPL